MNKQISTDTKLLYADLTYKIRAAIFAVRNELGSGHKEGVYHKALEKEFASRGISFVTEKALAISYRGEKVGVYRPDFTIDDKVILEIKAVPFLPRDSEIQMSYYLRGTKYKLGLLVNFGSVRLEIKRRIFT